MVILSFLQAIFMTHVKFISIFTFVILLIIYLEQHASHLTEAITAVITTSPSSLQTCMNCDWPDNVQVCSAVRDFQEVTVIRVKLFS